MNDLDRRMNDLERRVDALDDLPDAVAEIQGSLRTLTTLVTTRFDQVQPAIERANTIRTALTFASVVIIPIIVAVIAGYFALRAAGPPR